ncbi:DUF1080 domain-containing protein [Aureitalea sp. L0-47]|uniref:3-keto-disaccharide hydrolase n=1 Tax=Aureitalea sp. L0-47 TaxID=2816962 RepID=UPI0022377188|nr:DUF1080 domain-containing protein [Aureitalea sp. L0-47]MCW5519090.1 DUF1080 domain-containing protein [Aureitalea sp. L0-47]
MKKCILLALVALIGVSCNEKVKEESAEPEANTTAMEKEVNMEESGWITLFDGTNFDSWRGYLAEGMYDNWTVEDGAMAFTPDEDGGKNIITKEKFTNFVLSLEWKISEGGNSGIFWSVYEDEKYPEAYETGPEIQVLDNMKHPDAKVGDGLHTAGALYDMIKPSEDVTKPAGEWNLCVIEINHKTNMGKVTLNGTEIVSFPVHGEEWDNMVANSKFADWEGFGKYQTGHIGLQDHDDKVWYRNIKIKKLD